MRARDRLSFFLSFLTAVVLLLLVKPLNGRCDHSEEMKRHVGTAIPECLDRGDSPDDATKSELVVVAEGEASLSAVFRLGEYTIEEISVDGGKFVKFSAPTLQSTDRVGSPQLPVLRTLIAVPPGKRAEIVAIPLSSRRYENLIPYPVQIPETDAGIAKSSSQLNVNREDYQSLEIYPPKLASIKGPFYWRNAKIMELTIAPFRAITGSRTCRVTDRIRIDVTFVDDPSAREHDRVLPSIPVRKQLVGILSDHIINYPVYGDSLVNGQEQLSSREPGTWKYLIITPDEYIAGLSAFADWYHRMGMPVRVLGLSETGGTANEIKNTIMEYYESCGIEYVLLIGDVDQLPIPSWERIYSDYWYSCLTGGGDPDLFPEVAIGRLSVTSAGDLVRQIEKILSYQKHPPQGGWLEHDLLVAHYQDAPAKYQKCKQDICNEILKDRTRVTRLYGSEGATDEDVVNVIDHGVSRVNYRGHGGCDRWLEWNIDHESFTCGDLYTLENDNRHPVVFNVDCLNGSIVEPECLSESWMRVEHGAVASLGATVHSYTEPNHVFDYNLYDAFMNKGITDLGSILIDANAGIYDMGRFARDNIRMYLWLGDPAMRIWTGIPSPISVVFNESISENGIDLDIDVYSQDTPVQEATACISSGEDVYSVGTSDAEGRVSFSLPVLYSGILDLIVTYPGYLPRESWIAVNPTLKMTLDPESLRVSRGDSLHYILTVENSENKKVEMSFQACFLQPDNRFYPEGSKELVVERISLEPGEDRKYRISHRIEDNAMLGGYTFHGFLHSCETMLEECINTSSFDFTVYLNEAQPE